MGIHMHTVEKSNVVKKNNIGFKNTDVSSSYTSILNSAVNSTKREYKRNKINRFFYSIGEFNFLIEKDLKVENLPKTAINKVPHVPDWCTGIISVRGVIMPVINMQEILNNELKLSPKESNSKTYLLMIEHKHHAPVALQLDRLPESVNIKQYTYSDPEKNTPSWLERTWENSTNKLYEVNHDVLFNKIKAIKL